MFAGPLVTLLCRDGSLSTILRGGVNFPPFFFCFKKTFMKMPQYAMMLLLYLKRLLFFSRVDRSAPTHVIDDKNTQVFSSSFSVFLERAQRAFSLLKTIKKIEGGNGGLLQWPKKKILQRFLEIFSWWSFQINVFETTRCTTYKSI